MVAAIFNAIAAIPELLAAVKSLISWITAQIDQAEKKKIADDLAKAIAKAQQNKDTSGMDQVFDPSKKT